MGGQAGSDHVGAHSPVEEAGIPAIKIMVKKALRGGASGVGFEVGLWNSFAFSTRSKYPCNI